MRFLALVGTLTALLLARGPACAADFSETELKEQYQDRWSKAVFPRGIKNEYPAGHFDLTAERLEHFGKTAELEFGVHFWIKDACKGEMDESGKALIMDHLARATLPRPSYSIFAPLIHVGACFPKD